MSDSTSPRFSYTTPFNPPSRERDEAVAEAMNNPLPQGLKVLIADDSLVVIKVLSSVLRRAGFEVFTATDGIEATQAIYREMPDVILLDIFMPRMNGYQVCRLIKQDEAVAHIPVLINTASEGRSAEFWSLHTGADGFMMKGIAPDQLLEAIARVTNGKTSPPASDAQTTPTPEEILSKVCALVDQELYTTTVKGMELETMLANLTEGVLTVDNTNCISSANHFLCGLLGQEEDGLKGRDCSEALGEILGDTIRQLIELALQSDDPVSRESEVTAHDEEGKVTPVSISAVPVRDYLGEVVGAICVFQDITRLREIESLNRLKNDLTDMIVHDLRTPLTSLLSGIETMEMLGGLTEDQEELMNISISGGHILLGMINDLLDISKMEDGSMQIERANVEVADLMQRAVQQVTALAQAKDVRLICESGPDVSSLPIDDNKMLRTLVNLLSNAIKFTPAKGDITLAAHFVARPERRDSVVFACQDTGEGIPEEAFARIFEKFGQVETRTAGRKMSTGLGLTFCKMAVEAHHGRIWVQSAMGHGSTFSFAVPTTELV